jgi:hypothetical protein
MTIETRPRFYYIDPITLNNNYLNFVEPNVSAFEITTLLNPKSRTMTDLMTEVTRALNDAGVNTYTVTLNRTTRLVTIAADDDFDLLIATGSNAGLSVFSTLGFIGGDLTGSDNYTGTVAIGSSYVPQFLPQDYLGFDYNLEGVQASVNESASGAVEVITFGSVRYMEMNLKYITDRPKVKGHPIENNPNAVEQAQDFLTFLIRKQPLEFMEDRDDVATFDKCILESTSASKNGVAFELREMGRLIGFRQTGKLTFRKVN